MQPWHARSPAARIDVRTLILGLGAEGGSGTGSQPAGAPSAGRPAAGRAASTQLPRPHGSRRAGGHVRQAVLHRCPGAGSFKRQQPVCVWVPYVPCVCHLRLQGRNFGIKASTIWVTAAPMQVCFACSSLASVHKRPATGPQRPVPVSGQHTCDNINVTTHPACTRTDWVVIS